MLVDNFNSRPSARGDENVNWRRTQMDISIHAPPRGATRARQHYDRTRYHFNSRPSARGDGCAGKQFR